MDNQRNLFMRGKKFYFRVKREGIQIKLSLYTTDYYKACHLRDVIMSKIKSILKAKGLETTSEIVESDPKIYKKIAAEVIVNANSAPERLQIIKENESLVSKAIDKNGGAIPEAFYRSVDEFIPEVRIKDQRILEGQLRQYLMILEEKITRNAGICPDELLEDFRRNLHRNISGAPSELQKEIADESDGELLYTNIVDGSTYVIKDFSELRRFYNEAVVRISVSYLNRYDSSFAASVVSGNTHSKSSSQQESADTRINRNGEFVKGPEDGSSQQFDNPSDKVECASGEVIDNAVECPKCGISFEDLWRKYSEDRMRKKKWKSAATKKKVTGEYETLKFILGEDFDIGTMNREKAEWFVDVAYKLPTQRKNKPKWRDLSLLEILNSTVPDDEKVTDLTANKYVMLLSALMTFSVEREYIQKNYVKEFVRNEDDIESGRRNSFSNKDLEYIAGGLVLYKKSKESCYWATLIGMYTGARIEEICKINTEDACVDEEIPYLSLKRYSFNESIKNKSSIRRVPLHKDLIELGILEFIRSRGEHEKLFEFNKKETGYSKDLHNFFNKSGHHALIKDMPDNKGKSFHSFRHTVASRMLGDGFTDSLVSKLLGHAQQGMTRRVYTNFELRTLKDEIDKLCYPQSVRALLRLK